jgi:hypothetical protein
VSSGLIPYPEKRRAILVVSETDLTYLRSKAEKDISARKLIKSQETYLLNIDDDEVRETDLLKKLQGDDLIQVGNFLIQSPYHPDSYRTADQALSQFPIEKYVRFTTLCNLLGAQVVVIESFEEKTSEGITNAKISSNLAVENTKVVEQNNQFSRDAKDILKAILKIKTVSPGGEPDVKGAKKFLSDYRLAKDEAMQALIEQRQNTRNMVGFFSMTFGLTEESNRNLEVLSTLTVPDYIKVNIDANLKQKFKNQRNYEIAVKVIFESEVF